MYQRLEQLLQIKQICLSELKQAQANCEKYSSHMTTLTEQLSSSWQDSKCFLAEYDSFLTNITSTMDATRKFNIQVNLYNMKLSEINGISLKAKQENCSVKNAAGKLRSHLFPAEEYDINVEPLEDFVYPTLNLSEVYKKNEIISGIVTYVKSLKDLSFFMFDCSSQYRAAVVELSKSLELRQYHGLPTTFEIFGCVLDNQIFRAVLANKTLYDEEMNEKILPCYLLDTGEILPLKSDNLMYKLTDDQKKMPALALPCQLVTNIKQTRSKKIKGMLKKIEYKQCNFKIIEIKNNTLQVEIVDSSSIKADLDLPDNLAAENTVVEKNSIKRDKLQLTEEELEMLYEEPLSTSNAMKAVMGYDPKDDKRICRFYDPLTGGCFKGVNCKLEHTFRDPDGWTKDVLPAPSIVDSQHPITIFNPGSIINITPTYIGHLDRFFAQINEESKSCHPLVWNDEDIPSWRLLKNPPHMFELVLSRYVDGLWYRAKIISHDDEYSLFKVLYVDYGNTQAVHLRNLASIDNSTAQLPFQAVLCRLENVNEKPISPEERKNCIEILCEMILNKAMDVRVISHYEDLFISFVDKNAFPLPDILVDMGFLDQNKNKILL